MRKKDREVKDPLALMAIMAACDRMVLAFNGDPAPYLLPVNPGVERVGDRFFLYFHGAVEGRKYRYLADGVPVSFEMDTDHDLFADPNRGYCTMYYESVIGQGLVYELTAAEDKDRALQLIVDHYHLDDGFSYSRAAIPRTRVFKIEVTAITGKVKRKKN
ncbi:pyridoxamine 5'-phosphate oxidase family protein [Peptococcus simiae]|uniref:pyridoxamine 5'-phosphate oxidase family protein n=1 Tax=Peptococcus simiae TaxID=1643805 RepID=UPI00397F4910